jgi:hypothetical protein
MFDLSKPFRAEIVGLKLVVKHSGPAVSRYFRFKLRFQLTAEIAPGLGSHGRTAWENVRAGVMHKAVMIIDALRAKVRLIGAAAEITIATIQGVKAVITGSDAPTDEETGPVDPGIDVEWEGSLSDEAWVFMARHAHAYVDVALARQNPELPNVDAPPSRRTGGARPKAPKPERLASVLPFAAAEPETPLLDDLRDEAQLADTPEEAEQIRADRLAHFGPAGGFWDKEVPPKGDDADPDPAPKSATDADGGLVF